MPQIPTPEQFGQRNAVPVQPALKRAGIQAPRTNTSLGTAGAISAKAYGDAAKSLGAAASGLGNMIVEVQDKKDRNSALEATHELQTMFSNFQTNDMHERQGKYADGITKDFEEQWSKTLDALASPMTRGARERFMESANQSFVGYRDSIAKYELNQIDDETRKQTTNEINSLINNGDHDEAFRMLDELKYDKTQLPGTDADREAFTAKYTPIIFQAMLDGYLVVGENGSYVPENLKAATALLERGHHEYLPDETGGAGDSEPVRIPMPEGMRNDYTGKLAVASLDYKANEIIDSMRARGVSGAYGFREIETKYDGKLGDRVRSMWATEQQIQRQEDLEKGEELNDGLRAVANSAIAMHPGNKFAAEKALYDAYNSLSPDNQKLVDPFMPSLNSSLSMKSDHILEAVIQKQYDLILNNPDEFYSAKNQRALQTYAPLMTATQRKDFGLNSAADGSSGTAGNSNATIEKLNPFVRQAIENGVSYWRKELGIDDKKGNLKDREKEVAFNQVVGQFEMGLAGTVNPDLAPKLVEEWFKSIAENDRYLSMADAASVMRSVRAYDQMMLTETGFEIPDDVVISIPARIGQAIADGQIPASTASNFESAVYAELDSIILEQRPGSPEAQNVQERLDVARLKDLTSAVRGPAIPYFQAMSGANPLSAMDMLRNKAVQDYTAAADAADADVPVEPRTEKDSEVNTAWDGLEFIMGQRVRRSDYEAALQFQQEYRRVRASNAWRSVGKTPENPPEKFGSIYYFLKKLFYDPPPVSSQDEFTMDEGFAQAQGVN